ncbi:hypothetical protein C1646_814790 [Rhizophagus diaphanus]|nr:hypothetical protein C1646_814790 [Rhizophagus diaphanus] [Rhizophagus sp. MUCL 43196]
MVNKYGTRTTIICITIISICLNSALCEWGFSICGWICNKRQLQLGVEHLELIAKITLYYRSNAHSEFGFYEKDMKKKSVKLSDSEINAIVNNSLAELEPEEDDDDNEEIIKEIQDFLEDNNNLIKDNLNNDDNKNNNCDNENDKKETGRGIINYNVKDLAKEFIDKLFFLAILSNFVLCNFLAELKLWGNPIKLLIKRQHKYQTLRVKIALSSFSLPQFNNNWTTDLGGIPDVTTYTLWQDQRSTTYLHELGAKSFKIIQTGKGKRKLVGYFKIWEAVRKVLDYHQVLSSEGIRLSWCQHSTPNLKKAPMTKDHSGGKKTDFSNVKSKKKDQQSSSKAPNKSNKLKKPLSQNKKDSDISDNSKKKAKGGNNLNKKVLAKILEISLVLIELVTSTNLYFLLA